MFILLVEYFCAHSGLKLDLKSQLQFYLAKIINNWLNNVLQAGSLFRSIPKSILNVFGQKIIPGMAECGFYWLDRQNTECFCSFNTILWWVVLHKIAWIFESNLTLFWWADGCLFNFYRKQRYSGVAMTSETPRCTAHTIKKVFRQWWRIFLLCVLCGKSFLMVVSCKYITSECTHLEVLLQQMISCDYNWCSVLKLK